MIDTFCTQCNTRTELQAIEDMAGQTRVCMNCSRIESGFTEDWRSFVTALQTALPKDMHYKIGTILAIAKECTPNAHGLLASGGAATVKRGTYVMDPSHPQVADG